MFRVSFLISMLGFKGKDNLFEAVNCIFFSMNQFLLFLFSSFNDSLLTIDVRLQIFLNIRPEQVSYPFLYKKDSKAKNLWQHIYAYFPNIRRAIGQFISASIETHKRCHVCSPGSYVRYVISSASQDLRLSKLFLLLEGGGGGGGGYCLKKGLRKNL